MKGKFFVDELGINHKNLQNLVHKAPKTTPTYLDNYCT